MLTCMMNRKPSAPLDVSTRLSSRVTLLVSRVATVATLFGVVAFVQITSPLNRASATIEAAPPLRSQSAGRAPASAAQKPAPNDVAAGTVSNPKLKQANGKIRKPPATPTPIPLAHVASTPFPFKQSVIKKNNFIRNTQIVGCCIMLNTHARVETLEGKLLREDVLTTFDTFGINDLKPGVYNIVFVHPRYKIPLRLENVKTGNWVQFSSP